MFVCQAGTILIRPVRGLGIGLGAVFGIGPVRGCGIGPGARFGMGPVYEFGWYHP